MPLKNNITIQIELYFQLNQIKVLTHVVCLFSDYRSNSYTDHQIYHKRLFTINYKFDNLFMILIEKQKTNILHDLEFLFESVENTIILNLVVQ